MSEQRTPPRAVVRTAPPAPAYDRQWEDYQDPDADPGRDAPIAGEELWDPALYDFDPEYDQDPGEDRLLAGLPDDIRAAFQTGLAATVGHISGHGPARPGTCTALAAQLAAFGVGGAREAGAISQMGLAGCEAGKLDSC